MHLSAWGAARVFLPVKAAGEKEGETLIRQECREVHRQAIPSEND
jgi:hypothetical protein